MSLDKKMPQALIDAFTKATKEVARYPFETKGDLLPEMERLYYKYVAPAVHSIKVANTLKYIWEVFEGKTFVDMTDIIKECQTHPDIQEFWEHEKTESLLRVYLMMTFGNYGSLGGLYIRREIKNNAVLELLTPDHQGISDIEIKSTHRMLDMHLDYFGHVVYSTFKETKTPEGYSYRFVNSQGEDVFSFPNILTLSSRQFRSKLILACLSFCNDSDVSFSISYREYLLHPDLDKAIRDCIVITSLLDNSYFLSHYSFMTISSKYLSGDKMYLTMLDKFVNGPVYNGCYLYNKRQYETFILGLSNKLAPNSAINRHFNGLFGETFIIPLIFSFLPKVE